MLTKLVNCNFKSPAKLYPVTILIGTEPFLLNHCAQTILKQWQQLHYPEQPEKQLISLSTAGDWVYLHDALNSYNLFSSTQIIDVRYEKKNLDSAAKNFFQDYLKKPNHQSLLLLRAAHLPIKSVQSLAQHETVHVIAVSMPNATAIKHWLKNQLEQLGRPVHENIVDLIYQYNENNLLACSQVIDKLALIVGENEPITKELVLDQLSNHCDYALFDLADACLKGQADKTLLLLRQHSASKTEPSLVLWLLAQEIRLLMQLLDFTEQGMSTAQATSRLNIWSTRTGLYQQAINRYPRAFLRQLLHDCEQLDYQIKAGHQSLIWQSLEVVAMTLCLAKRVGYVG